MRDKAKRRGLGDVMRRAEERVYAEASANLSATRIQELKAAFGSSAFVAGNYPDAKWEPVVGFQPDREFHYQVTVGIAVDPGQPLNLIARAFVSRDPEEELCVIVWNPES